MGKGVNARNVNIPITLVNIKPCIISKMSLAIWVIFVSEINDHRDRKSIGFDIESKEAIYPNQYWPPSESFLATSLRIFELSQQTSLQIFENIYPNHFNRIKHGIYPLWGHLKQSFWHIQLPNTDITFLFVSRSKKYNTDHRIGHFPVRITWRDTLFTTGIRNDEYHPCQCVCIIVTAIFL